MRRVFVRFLEEIEDSKSCFGHRVKGVCPVLLPLVPFRNTSFWTKKEAIKSPDWCTVRIKLEQVLVISGILHGL